MQRGEGMDRLFDRRSWFVAAVLFVLFFQLGAAQLFDEDEPKNAACAKEMLARGDWIVPTYNHGLRTDKPILIYWLMIPAYHVFGVNEFAARFWSALLGAGTILITWRLGRKWFGETVGLTAAAVLLGCPLFIAVSRAATPESTLVFLTMIALFCHVRSLPILNGDAPPDAPRNASWQWAFYLATGLGVLAKGPVGFLLPMAVVWVFETGWAVLEARRAAPDRYLGWKWWLAACAAECSPLAVIRRIGELKLIPGTLLCLAVAAPWYIAVAYQTNGDWIRGFLGKHNVDRFLKPLENHRGPIYYYVVSTLAGTFPWALFVPGALAYAAARVFSAKSAATNAGPVAATSAAGSVSEPRPDDSRASHAAWWFVSAWAGVFFLFYSLASTKLPHYVLPAFPALALLVGGFMAALVRGEAKLPAWLWRTVFALTGVIGVGVSVGLYVAAQKFFPGTEVVALCGVPAILLAVAGWLAWRSHGPQGAATAWAWGGAAFVVVLVGWAPPLLNDYQSSAVVFKHLPDGGRDARLLAVRSFQTALAFYEPGKRTVYSVHELQDGVKKVEDGDVDAILVRADVLDEFRKAAPETASWQELGRWKRFLRDDTLVLLHRREAVAAREKPANR